jgi:hypothetical protein
MQSSVFFQFLVVRLRRDMSVKRPSPRLIPIPRFKACVQMEAGDKILAVMNRIITPELTVIREAQKLVAVHFVATPLVATPGLARSGTDVYLKLELKRPTLRQNFQRDRCRAGRKVAVVDGLWPVLDLLAIPRCGLHAFRHTHTSLLLDTGATPKVVQRQLRHADPRVTLGIYAHALGDAHREAVERVASAVFQSVPKAKEETKYIQ